MIVKPEISSINIIKNAYVYYDSMLLGNVLELLLYFYFI